MSTEICGKLKKFGYFSPFLGQFGKKLKNGISAKKRKFDTSLIRRKFGILGYAIETCRYVQSFVKIHPGFEYLEIIQKVALEKNSQQH